MTATPPGAAAILSQALPYIQELRAKTVVVKSGGRALADRDLARRIADGPRGETPQRGHR